MVSYVNKFIKNGHLNLISGSKVKIIISLPAVVLGVSAQLLVLGQRFMCATGCSSCSLKKSRSS